MCFSQIPEVFSWLQYVGNISDGEMLKTFNLGIGATLIVSVNHVETVLSMVRQNETAWNIGTIVDKQG